MSDKTNTPSSNTVHEPDAGDNGLAASKTSTAVATQGADTQGAVTQGAVTQGADKGQFVAELYQQQALPLIKFLASRYRNSAEAQDIAQEAWLRIFRLQHPEQLDNAKAFLFQTAANLAIDRARRGKLEQRYLDLELGLADAPLAPSMERTLAGRQALQQVEQTLAKLPPKCRQAFVLHRNRGLPYPEIAQQLGVSTSMIEKYIIQALKALRQTVTQ